MRFSPEFGKGNEKIMNYEFEIRKKISTFAVAKKGPVAQLDRATAF